MAVTVRLKFYGGSTRLYQLRLKKMAAKQLTQIATAKCLL